jgi:hypothetical protein
MQQKPTFRLTAGGVMVALGLVPSQRGPGRRQS